MNRNASTSRLLRLPPEIRLRIYEHVFGGQRLWMGFRGPQYKDNCTTHLAGHFYYFNMVKGSDRKLGLRLLRVCRQIFTEATLCPYSLNEFTFESQKARRKFVKSMRPGKKQIVRKAIKAYHILPLSTLGVS